MEMEQTSVTLSLYFKLLYHRRGNQASVDILRINYFDWKNLHMLRLKTWGRNVENFLKPFILFLFACAPRIMPQ